MSQKSEIVEVTSPAGYVVRVGSIWNYNRSLDNASNTRNLVVKRILQHHRMVNYTTAVITSYMVEFEQFMPYKTYGIDYFDGIIFRPAEPIKTAIIDLMRYADDVLHLITPNAGTVTYLKKPAVLQLVSDFVKQLIEDKYLLVTPGFEEYFKTLDLHESTTDSTMADGERVPGRDQGQVQGDGQIHQRNNGEGKRYSNDGG